MVMRYLLLSLALCGCADATAPEPKRTDCYVVNTATHTSDYYAVCPVAQK